MFTTEELQAIDAKYFRMIVLDPYDLTIQSKCTGHYWYLHSTGYPSDGSCIIFHIIRTLWLYELFVEKALNFQYSRNKKFA